jgi:hypothetical protein
MVSLRKLATAAAAAVLGGSLLAAAGPAAAVEAHSGIQPNWTTGAYPDDYRGAYGGRYRYNYPGWENPVTGVFGAVGGAVDGTVGGPTYANNYSDNTFPCYPVRKPLRDVYGHVTGFRRGSSCDWTGYP